MQIDDEVTGLRSRQGFMPLLGRQVVAACEHKSAMALLVVDIEGFVQVNGLHGYRVGDEMLRHLAAQLKAVARRQDFVARIGDDRFALLLTGMFNRGHVELAVQKLFRLLDVPLQASTVRLHVPVSIGIAMCPLHATHAEHLLRRAEAALLRARRDGLRHAFAPDADADLDISDLWDLELQLGGAIERGEMQLAFQPKVRVDDRRPEGAEALMRWTSLSRGVVSPAVFIPVAERVGQIKKLTVWALNSALRQAARWPADAVPRVVSVNLPGMLAAHADLPELVEDALSLWSGNDVRLMLEITEGSLMDPARAFPVLQRIRDLGVGISIDDFGTGYSCLAYFRNIPADELKIDRSFVTGLLTDPANGEIVRLIIELAHRFGLRVAAEGVEDDATFERLRELGCDSVQGYLFGRPMPAADFIGWSLGAADAMPASVG
ncbi:putative bifunctional diguanylate cyclase/phosphodiesterase [Lysobacter humi (ex Lee et al. 2017)]